MSGCIVRVVWTENSRPHGNCWFNMVETEFADLSEVCLALEGGALVGGDVLYTNRQDGRHIITKRSPVAFTKAAVARIELPYYPPVEAA